MSDDHVVEAYAAEQFFFDGIANLFVAGTMLHITFWSWQQTETGLFKLGVRRAVCPVDAILDCAEQALAAVAGSMTRKFARTMPSLS